VIERRIPLDPDSEVRVRALEDSSGAPVVDLRLWRKAPDDRSDDAFHPMVQGVVVPLAVFPVLLAAAWKVQRAASEQAIWAEAARLGTMLDRAS
jgi:hypothetical protein